MMTRKSNLSPKGSSARLALFAAFLSGSAMAAAQDVTAPGPVIEMPAPAEPQQPVEPVIAAPAPVEPPVIMIPSTPPVANTPAAPVESAAPVAMPGTKAAPPPQKSVAKPIAKRATPATADTPAAVAAAPAVALDAAIQPEAGAIAVPDMPEPVAVVPYNDTMATQPVDNGNADDNWLLVAAGLGLLGAAGGAAVVAGKRRRRQKDLRTDNGRTNPGPVPATKAAMPVHRPELSRETRAAPLWATAPAMAAPSGASYQEQRIAERPASEPRITPQVVPRWTDPVFASRVSGPPITDPLFSAKVDMPPVTDPLFRNHRDYVGPQAQGVRTAPSAKTGWGDAARTNREQPTPEFAV